MMKRRELAAIVLGTLLLAGCATRTDRLAPVESRAIEGPSGTQAPLPPSIPEGGAEVRVTTLPAPDPVSGTPRPLGTPPPAADARPEARPAPSRPPVETAAPAQRQLVLAAPAAKTPAVDDILRDVRRRWAAGQHEQAAAGLERALRIEPANPYLWQHLAAVRLDQDKNALAEQFAAKSNSVAGENAPLRLRNWRIIAEARRRAGDAEGSRAAEARAARYGNGR